MLRIALYFLFKNNRGTQKELLYELGMPRSTFNSLITHRSQSIKLHQADAIKKAINSLRLHPEVIDASLLLPMDIPLAWRWAARDMFNRWHLFNSPSPPNPNSEGWAFPKFISDPAVTLDPTLHVIPPDIDLFNNHLYQRDLASGIWRKTFAPEPTNPMIPAATRDLTEEEIQERCLWFTDWTSSKSESVSNMLIRR